MKRIAKFEKVSFEQFCEDMYKQQLVNIYGSHERVTEDVKDIYKNINLPGRATSGSAGYDFHLVKDINLTPGQSITIPTGIRVVIDDGWVLKCYPRSGLGFKYRLQLDNSVGIIDSDFIHSDNEGHIHFKITNDSKDGKILKLKAGDRFAQGVFVEYGITYDDNVTGKRNGGFGSTDKS